MRPGATLVVLSALLLAKATGADEFAIPELGGWTCTDPANGGRMVRLACLCDTVNKAEDVVHPFCRAAVEDENPYVIPLGVWGGERVVFRVGEIDEMMPMHMAARTGAWGAHFSDGDELLTLRFHPLVRTYGHADPVGLVTRYGVAVCREPSRDAGGGYEQRCVEWRWSPRRERGLHLSKWRDVGYWGWEVYGTDDEGVRDGAAFTPGQAKDVAFGLFGCFGSDGVAKSAINERDPGKDPRFDNNDGETPRYGHFLNDEWCGGYRPLDRDWSPVTLREHLDGGRFPD